MFSLFFVGLLLLFTFPAAPTAWADVSGQAANGADKIGAESFFRRNAVDHVRLSPDGSHLAMVSTDADDNVMLRIVNVDTGDMAASFSIRQGDGIADFYWATNERILISTHRYMGGLEAPMITGEIFGLNIDNTRKFQLVGPGVGDFAVFRVENILPDTPNRVRVTRYEVNRSSVARSRPVSLMLDINTRPPGNRSSMMRNLSGEVRSPLPWGELHSDRSGLVRLATAIDEDMQQQVRFRTGNGSWEDIGSLFNQDAYAGGFSFAGFSNENEDFYFLQRSESGTIGLYRFVADDRSISEVFVHPQFDITRNDLILSSARDAILGVKFSGHVFEVHYFSDHPEVALQKSLDAAFPGELARMTSMSVDGRRSLVGVVGPQRIGEFYLLDNHARQMLFIGGINSELPMARMSPVTPFAIRSPDGLILSGYLTKPADAQSALPAVVIPHGGPIGVRDDFYFNREAQYLAHHGYAVLQVNFRGSGGFGYEHLEHGFGQWGTGMIDDLRLALRWAVQAGHVDSERVCIYGASYGAFAALSSLARYPADYRCAAAYAGVYDLNELSRSDVPFIPGGEAYLAIAVGSDPDELRRQSPVNLASDIRAPVLLVHGGQDRRAPRAQADAMRSALQAAGNEPQWIFRPSEGHGFYNQEYRVHFYRALLDFMDQHTGSP